MITFGIDPGMSGAIVGLSDGGNVIFACAADDRNGGYCRAGQIDAKAIRGFIDFAAQVGPVRIVIEQQQCRPMEGRTSILKIGKNWGTIIGACHGYPVLEPIASVWTRAILGSKTWNTQAEKKDATIAFVQRRLPSLDLVLQGRRTPHDGLADAACLAMWGMSQP
jgi:hypothetical protein